MASLPGGWDLAHAIRLGIKPFAELGANSEALSWSQVDSPCSCRAIFESAPVTMLQSRKNEDLENPSFDLSLGMASEVDQQSKPHSSRFQIVQELGLVLGRDLLHSI